MKTIGISYIVIQTLLVLGVVLGIIHISLLVAFIPTFVMLGAGVLVVLLLTILNFIYSVTSGDDDDFWLKEEEDEAK